MIGGVQRGQRREQQGGEEGAGGFHGCIYSTTMESSFSRTSLERDMPIGHSGAT